MKITTFSGISQRHAALSCGGDTNTSLKEATCILHETSHTHYVLHYDRPGDDTLVVQLAGSWKLEDGLPAMTELQRQLDVTPRVQRLVFDAHDMTAWDSGLLTFVREVVEQSTSRQMVVDQRGLPAGVQRLLALAAGNPRALRDASPEPKIRAFLRRGEAGATTA